MIIPNHLKQKALDRTDGLCGCTNNCGQIAEDIHHLVPVGNKTPFLGRIGSGSNWHVENMIPLSRKCHAEVHRSRANLEVLAKHWSVEENMDLCFASEEEIRERNMVRRERNQAIRNKRLAKRKKRKLCLK